MCDHQHRANRWPFVVTKFLANVRGSGLPWHRGQHLAQTAHGTNLLRQSRRSWLLKELIPAGVPATHFLFCKSLS